MGKIGKTLALLLTLIIAMSCLTLLVFKPANAQSTAKPSIPQFTLSFVNASYSKGSDFFQNEVIVISIVNQPFTSYFVGNNSVDLYYKISWNTSSTTTGLSQFWGFNNTVWLASNSKTTDITLNFVTNNYSVPLGLSPPLPDIPVGGQADFQVQASIGYFWYGNSWFDLSSSDWSPIQTIIIPESNASPTQSQTPTLSPSPTVPEFSLILIVTLLLSVFSIAAIRHRKTSKLNQ